MYSETSVMTDDLDELCLSTRNSIGWNNSPDPQGVKHHVCSSIGDRHHIGHDAWYKCKTNINLNIKCMQMQKYTYENSFSTC